MGEISEFFRRETAFTPETIQILAAALDEAWERLRQSGGRLARPAYSRAMREVVAKRIIEMASVASKTAKPWWKTPCVL
jgi:hypothetical protein